MNKYQLKHTITLSDREEAKLRSITKKGKEGARIISRARILLKSAHGMKDTNIASLVDVSKRTVENVRKRFAEGGIDRALYDAPRPGQPKKLTNEGEAYLVALACSDPPEGHTHWTLACLQERLIKDKQVPKDITTVAIWKRLDQRGIKPWREKNVVHSERERTIY
jgi:transposase